MFELHPSIYKSLTNRQKQAQVDKIQSILRIIYTSQHSFNNSSILATHQ